MTDFTLRQELHGHTADVSNFTPLQIIFIYDIIR